MKVPNHFHPNGSQLALAILLLSTRLSCGAGEAVDTGKYHDFTIDCSKIRDIENLEAVRQATKEQIDIVCAVGLPKEILEFFQTMPIHLVPSSAIPSGSPGFYNAAASNVNVSVSMASAGHKPILLHEYLHSYHHQRLEGGFRNQDILKYYNRGKSTGAYGTRSHMMDNGSEFFACSATTFLFGVTAQEPFKRDKVRDNQPEFFEHLKKIFGPGAGSYEGSIERKPVTPEKPDKTKF
jgi:hypothetical protein